MPGIFGDLFDFDGDGKLDCVEQAAEFILFDRMMNEDEDDSLSEFDDDFDEDDEDI